MNSPIRVTSKALGIYTACLVVFLSANASAETASGPSAGDQGSEEMSSQSTTGPQSETRRYPYGYQFYRHGRGHRHGPTRGYYHSKILSSQG